MKKIINIASYISEFPGEIQKIIEQVRETIKKAAPKAEEVISYQMPAYKMNGILVYFAAFKNHIGFYPTSSAIKTFSKELKIYKSGKGSVQFPIDKPIPVELIDKIVKFRVNENLQKKHKNQSGKHV
jgi:uncharacterized protein YdhG (YjbR/CyaY superfamily)